MACAPSEDSDQPGHPPSLIKVFAVRMKKALAISYPLSAQRRLWSDRTDAQADLSLRWVHVPFCWFCHKAAQYALCQTYQLSRSSTKPTKWPECPIKPAHEIMALFVLCKLILQTRMRSHLVVLDVWPLVGPVSTSILYVCEQRRIWRVFAGRLCDKYQNLMSWLN